MQSRYCISSLPEDCIGVICDYASGSLSLYRFKLRLTLSLVNRAGRQLYVDGWLQPRVPRQRLFDALKPIVAACPIVASFPRGVQSFYTIPAFQIAAFSELYYESVRCQLPQLVEVEPFFDAYRYHPVGKKEGISMRVSDYNNIKKTLDSITKHRKSMAPYEKHCFFTDLEKYASSSNAHYDIVVNKAGNTTPLEQLFLYVDKAAVEKKKHVPTHWSKRDLTRLVPLRDALRDGLSGGDRLFNVSNFHLVRGTLAEHWTERVRKMKLLKLPLKLLAKSVKRRGKK